MAAAKKPKRPPRQVWINFREGTHIEAFSTKKKATVEKWADERTVGPYILAERVRER